MTTEDHAPIHAVYVRITNRPVIYDTRKYFAWQSWLAMGWTEADLRLVVAFILRRIKEGKRWQESLRFGNLIENHERFADDLIDAKMAERQVKPTPRAKLLASVGREEVLPDRVKSAASIIAESKALADLQAFKASL